MKVTYTIQDQQGYVASTLSGPVTLPELGAHIQALWADPAWRSDFNGILDFSAATIDVTEQELQGLTKAMATDPRCSFGKFAFVVSTAAEFAKLRKIDQVADDKATLRIFFDRRSAEGWLAKSAGR